MPGTAILMNTCGGGDSALGVTCRAGLELRRAESPAERSGALPYRHVDERRAADSAAVELPGDEAGLLLHERGVVGPHLKEALDVAGRHVELVDEHDRAVVVLQLLGVSDLVVHLTQSHRSRFSLRRSVHVFPSLRADLPPTQRRILPVTCWAPDAVDDVVACFGLGPGEAG